MQLFATASAAHWLFMLFALALLLAIYSAWRSAEIAQPVSEQGNLVQTADPGDYVISLR